MERIVSAKCTTESTRGHLHQVSNTYCAASAGERAGRLVWMGALPRAIDVRASPVVKRGRFEELEVALLSK
jgi:hypothetical protein